MIKQLSAHGIIASGSFVDGITKTIGKKDNDSIVFKVRMGCFQTNISLLKVHKSISDFNRKKVAEVIFAGIFFHRVKGKEYAIKSQRIQDKNHRVYNSSLNNILQEYFFCKIAAVLRFGPKTDNIFGYDLVCYEGRVEFAMELC